MSTHRSVLPGGAEELSEGTRPALAAARRQEESRAMSTEQDHNDNEINEDGPGVNGDTASWLYVLGGIPAMIRGCRAPRCCIGSITALALSCATSPGTSRRSI